MTAELAWPPLEGALDIVHAPKRVLVIDDQELVQAGLRAILSTEPWVAKCYGATDAESAEAILRRVRPHVVLIDVCVNGVSGLEISRRLLTAQPHVKTMLMSSTTRVPTSTARSYGLSGCIPKAWRAAAVSEAVRRVASGVSVFPREDESTTSLRLSAREVEILEQLVKGLSNPEIANVLFLSRHTVKQHTCAVYKKLGVRNRAEAVGKARELGLVA